MWKSFRYKVSFVMVGLFIFISAASAFLVMNSLINHALVERLNRGFPVQDSNSHSLEYRIVSNTSRYMDQLVLDVIRSHEDVLYVAVVDNGGRVQVYGNLQDQALHFEEDAENVVVTNAGRSVRKVQRVGDSYYEFNAPIIFGEKKVAALFIGISAKKLMYSLISERKEVLYGLVVVVSLGIMGIFIASSYITAPLARLSEGISRVTSSGHMDEIKVTSKDEISFLTHHFNEMARTINYQEERFALHTRNLEETFISTLRILVAALDARDSYTLGHSTRVAKMSILLGKKLGLDTGALKKLQVACLFHDVGKIRVPDVVLNKPAPLSLEEVELMKKHPEHGVEILRLAESLHQYIPAVLYHHEWYDGGGYPEGIKGSQIPLFASIIGIADAYDAMTSDRPYKKGLSKEGALRELIRFKGVQFNPYVADNFVHVLKSLWRQYEEEK